MDAQAASSLSSGYKRDDNWEVFWNQYAGGYARQNRSRISFYQNIVNYLENEGVISLKSNVLDIGCGPGTYTIPLAFKAASVTGLDPAEHMLDVMKSEADHYGVLDRILGMSEPWLSFSGKTEYDLVFGANTPAIKDYYSLMKMNSLSRLHCCLISFTGSYHSLLRCQLWEHIMKTPLKSDAFDIQYPFNILYSEGFYPNTKFVPYHWESTYSIDELVDHYTSYFTLFKSTKTEERQEIRSFLTGKSNNGLITDVQQGMVAIIWWKVS